MPSSGPSGPERAPTHEARAARLSYLLVALAGAGAVAYNHPAEATIITCGNPGLGGCFGYGGDLAIVPDTPSVQQGTQALVDVGFAQVTSLVRSYDITIDWDPTLLSFSGLSFYNYLDGPDFSIQNPNPGKPGTGTLEVAEFSEGNLANQTGFGPLPLFQITFDTIGAGISPLTIDPTATVISNPFGVNYTDFVTIDNSLQITPAPVSSVPEPGGLWLLASGLLALAGASRVRWRIRG